MKASYNPLTFLTVTFLSMCMACAKRADLEKVPDSTLLVIKTASEAQALLDNTNVMSETPALSELSADNIYLADSGTFYPFELNAYLWKPDIFGTQKLAGDWFSPYQQVYYANSILEAIPSLTASNQQQLDHIKGTALFIRGYAFHNVALEFANLYNPVTAKDDRGIPLRLTADPLTQTARASVEESYRQIVRDVKAAAGLLPHQPDPARKNRPSVPAAFALLARVYLSMSDYTNARLYADSCLSLYPTLLDYYTIDSNMINPFSANNEEVLYQSNLLSTTLAFYPGNCYVDSNLFKSFSEDDLRKKFFFFIDMSGLPIPGYSYSGDITWFSGLAVDEVMLIRAECNARQGFTSEAMNDLTTLLKTRWKKGMYTPPAIHSANEALKLILEERRKELVFRGLRWMDIRRLNRISATITLKRSFAGQEYTLFPGDKRYILPIPPDVIAINASIEQNERE